MYESRINTINKFVVDHIDTEHELGLLHGKMGVAIYMFFQSKHRGNEKFNELANDLIDEIYSGIETLAISVDFGKGLAGIGWGIEHLVKRGFLEACTDEILIDVDEKVFQYMTTNKDIPIDLSTGILGLGFYLIARLKNKDLVCINENDFLLKQLLIQAVNQLYEAIDTEDYNIYKEPITFSATWNLPLLFVFLLEVLKLKIYNSKVAILLNRLLEITKNVIPINHGNMLYLLLSVAAVFKISKTKDFNEHYIFLKRIFNEDIMLQQFQDKRILFENGLAGISTILNALNDSDTGRFKHLESKIAKQISSSEFWDNLEEKRNVSSGNLGLLSGICGIGISFTREL